MMICGGGAFRRVRFALACRTEPLNTILHQNFLGSLFPACRARVPPAITSVSLSTQPAWPRTVWRRGVHRIGRPLRTAVPTTPQCNQIIEAVFPVDAEP